MTDTKDFVHDVKGKIEERHGEIVKFRVIAEVADPDDQAKFYQIIEDIVEKENAVQEKLAAFDKSGTVDRTDMADEIEKLQKRVEDAIEAARVKINREFEILPASLDSPKAHQREIFLITSHLPHYGKQYLGECVVKHHKITFCGCPGTALRLSAAFLSMSRINYPQ